jgi:hypothetical protein
MEKPKSVPSYLYKDEKALLVEIARQDDRSLSRTIAMLIREEARRRGIGAKTAETAD